MRFPSPSLVSMHRIHFLSPISHSARTLCASFVLAGFPADRSQSVGRSDSRNMIVLITVNSVVGRSVGRSDGWSPVAPMA